MTLNAALRRQCSMLGTSIRMMMVSSPRQDEDALNSCGGEMGSGPMRGWNRGPSGIKLCRVDATSLMRVSGHPFS